MALVFEAMPVPGLGDVAYLIGDDASATAAVVDPQLDVERYVGAARRHKVAITHVLQTHVHEDFVSGARALAAAAPGAQVLVGAEAVEPYGYEHRPIRDGDRIELGSAVLTARHAPGHTPEHVAFLVAEAGREDSPWAVFSGGSLLVNSAGRSDLLGDPEARGLAAAQYRTLTGLFAPLGDHVIVYPTHAFGSACGAAIGDRPSTTLGYERRFNPYLQARDEAAFIELALGRLPPRPRHYARLKRLNTDGPPVDGGLPAVPALAPRRFQQEAARGEAALVDTRHMLAFGGGHIEGALNIGAAPQLPIWAGWMLDAGKPILLVLEKDEDLEAVLRSFARTGFTRFAGYLLGGMTAWDKAGLPMATLPQVTVHELRSHPRGFAPLDVRAPGEWAKGHIPGARHVFLPEIDERLDALDPEAHYAVYCDSGYRASIAASELRRRGFRHVANVPGSWQAWRKAGFPAER